MKFVNYMAAVLLAITLAPGASTLAQDDFDFDSLLDEITETPAEEPASSEEMEEAEESVDEEVMDDMADEDGAIDEAADDEFDFDFEEAMGEPEDLAEEPAMEEVMEEEAMEEEAAAEDDLGDLLDELAEEPAEEEAQEMVGEEMMESDMPPADVVEEGDPLEGLVEEAAEETESDMGEMFEEAEAAEPAQMPEGEAAKLAYQEEVRRQAAELEGRKALADAEEALERGQYEVAAQYFERTLKNTPERSATMPIRDRARKGLVRANYELAELSYKKGDLEGSKRYLNTILNYSPDDSKSLRLKERIEKKEVELAEMDIPMAALEEVKEKQTSIDDLFEEGKAYFELGEYNEAEALFETILIRDEYNKDAMRFLKRIEDIKYKLRTRERDANAAAMMSDVRNTWNAPLRKEVELPETLRRQGQSTSISLKQDLQQKMESLVIPSIEFRQANITDVVQFLVQVSRDLDPEGVGVNIILNLNMPGESSRAAPAPAPSRASDPFGDAEGFGDFGFEDDFFPDEGGGAAPAPAMGGGMSSIPSITLNLRRITLLDAIRYITEVAGLKFRLEDRVVIITPANVVSGRVVTRMYPVQPSILDVIIETEQTDRDRGGEFIEMGGGRTQMKRGDVREFFQRAGVPFPVGTTITYNPSISQLIVANTPDNLEIFERVLAQINVVPNQVEIEARFVEIAQGDLRELGFEWLITDDYEIAVEEGPGPDATKERIQINADSEGVSKGLRFFDFDLGTGEPGVGTTVTRQGNDNLLPIGDILSIAGVLTNPELEIVIHALEQSGNTDLLSAPRVTTRSGVNAQIEVVEEIIYPTEFEVTQPTIQSDAGILVTPPTVTPGAFETRETGVILNVTPTVGPDGYTIDLTLIPEVAELIDWIQYGSAITLNTGILGAEDRTFVYNIPQPIFSSRNVTTSIVIWDGQTVVMGGLIREDLVTINDRIPILGDIPFLGRLFRNEGERSRKQNLLIFVTARLVDPAGQPIHRADAMAMPGGGTSPIEGITP